MSFYFFGLYDFFFLVSIILISRFDFARDRKAESENKITENHGITKNQNSRLGGILLLFFILISQLNNSELSYFNLSDNYIYFSIMIFVCLLGFADDALGGIHYSLKLFFLIFAVIMLFLSYDQYLYNYSGIVFFDNILQNQIISILISLLVIVGFTNALNIADGANGIVSGIASFIFLVFYLETETNFFLNVFNFLLIFCLYNLIKGKVFLGDSGSYLFGFMISSISILAYNNKIVSAGLLATLLSYPSIEIFLTCCRRLLLIGNPLIPDNNHLHNFIFEKLKNTKLLFLSSNSYTGIIILTIFLLPGMISYFFLKNPFSMFYWAIFFFQFLLYILIYLKIKKQN